MSGSVEVAVRQTPSIGKLALRFGASSSSVVRSRSVNEGPWDDVMWDDEAVPVLPTLLEGGEVVFSPPGELSFRRKGFLEFRSEPAAEICCRSSVLPRVATGTSALLFTLPLLVAVTSPARRICRGLLSRKTTEVLPF